MGDCRVMSVYNEREARRYAVIACPTCGGQMLVPLYAVEHECGRCGDELELDWGRLEEGE